MPQRRAQKDTFSLRRKVLIQNAWHTQFVSRVFEHIRAYLVIYNPFPSVEDCDPHIKRAWSRAYNEQRPHPDGQISETPSHEDLEKAGVNSLAVVKIKHANI
jgi:hypothetical protein